jgi:hypothetical protein
MWGLLSACLGRVADLLGAAGAMKTYMAVQSL